MRPIVEQRAAPSNSPILFEHKGLTSDHHVASYEAFKNTSLWLKAHHEMGPMGFGKRFSVAL